MSISLFPATFSAGFGFAGTIHGGEHGLWIANCGAWRPESGFAWWRRRARFS